KGDTVARFGGEEFLLILLETSAEGAAILAERIRTAIATERFSVDGGNADVGVTISIGVALFPEHGKSAEAIVAAADQALYRSKQGGRDRVTVAR
ncbi:MAG: GGDEF domain-containing protein, partial [Gemmatimonadetes bacterium]|nr:GGDEF domain-containing protein [Gemmatimonadota bacterium]